MAIKKCLLLVLLVAATGCDAARFPSRFLTRTNQRQATIAPGTGSGDQSSGDQVLNSTGTSISSSGSGSMSTGMPASSSSTDSYASQSSMMASTGTTMMATQSTATQSMATQTMSMATQTMSSAGTTSGDYYANSGSNTGSSGTGNGNTNTGGGSTGGNGSNGGTGGGSTGGSGNANGTTGGTGSGTGNDNGNTGSTGSGNGNTGNTGSATGIGNGQRPNIVIFVADDLGRSDVSYTEGNIWTPTPHIDKLAWDGIILDRYYTKPVCTPTRSSFMTGKYQFHIGMQTASISQGEPWGVPLQFKFQPEYFKNLGYQTYHVGKWHLGEFTRQYYPVARGFDYSYGFTGGATNWWNYTEGWITPVPLSGRIIRENGIRVLANDTNNVYFPDLINMKAEQLIRNQDPSKPFYMYFCTPIVHTASNGYGDAMDTVPRFQLRPSVLSFSEQFPERKRQLALVQALDDSFMRITEAIVNKGIANNTIVVFISDNGAPVPETARFVRGANYGVNWPLRQGKGTLFDGGIRVPAFIWSPLLKKRGRVTSQLFDVTDWFPTLYEAAGGNVNDLANLNLDGISQWKSIVSGLNYGPRKEIVNNIDVINNGYSMEYEDQYGGLYKLIGGNVFDNSFLGWFPPDGTNALNVNEVPNWKTWTPITINCNFPAGQEVSPCLPQTADCLFDLTNDPCETNNIAQSYPAMLQLLQSKIKAYNATSFPSVIKPYDPAARPELWEGWFVPWKDPQPWDEGTHTNPFIPVDSF